jgi:hypothetical protein
VVLANLLGYIVSQFDIYSMLIQPTEYAILPICYNIEKINGMKTTPKKMGDFSHFLCRRLTWQGKYISRTLCVYAKQSSSDERRVGIGNTTRMVSNFLEELNLLSSVTLES